MAIFNGITNTSLVGDLRLAQMISQEIRLLLRDVNNLRNTPYVSFVGSINGMGSAFDRGDDREGSRTYGAHEVLHRRRPRQRVAAVGR